MEKTFLSALNIKIMGITTGTAVAKFEISGMHPEQHAVFVRFVPESIIVFGMK